MSASMKLVFAFCCAVIAVGLCAANTVPPQSQHMVQEALPAGAVVDVFGEDDDTYTDAPTTTTTTTTTAATTTTTTVAPQPPFYCHDCNSGSPLPEMWSNPQCSVAGNIDESYQPQYCDTFCYSSVGRYPAGGVYRGCASSQWFGDRVLAPGCFNDTGIARTVCLCAGDACNTDDMTHDSDRYVDQFCQDGGNSARCDNTV